MNYKVIDSETGENLAQEDAEFILFPDGSVWVAHFEDGALVKHTRPHIIEFAFFKNPEGDWVYTEVVFSKDMPSTQVF